MPDEYTVPYTFVAGTRAKASQVNANFDYVTEVLEDLDQTKAELAGDSSVNFSVAEPTLAQHAVTKRYVDLAVASSGGSGGSGVGKSMFEVFHTLSTKTPPGAFSLREGELILNAQNDYFAFWIALQEQGAGIIPDFTDTTELPEGYSSTFTNIESADRTYQNRVFSPYSWFTSDNAPSATEPIVAELELPELIKCSYFRINSHVFNTYNSTGDPDPGKAIKTASISIRQADDTWVPAVIINETEAPTSNDRYFESLVPGLEFNAIRIVISENFGATKTDVSVYPIDPESTSVRVVSEEQWQWEVANFNETGAFVLDEENDTIRLPKINRLLTGVTDMWQIGIPESNSVSRSGLQWQEGNEPIVSENSEATISLDTVSTGLWIQVYNAVADDALANIRYIPHAVLFEERPFRFLPEVETGWAIADGNWKDGEYYVDAMTELLNEYASAIDISGKNYKLSPKGFRFVEDSVYTSTYASYGESPYYVLDRENSRFKTPISTNYIRYTNTLDNTGDLLLDAAPNITASKWDVILTTNISGAFYQTNTGGDLNDFGDGGGVGQGGQLTFDASRSNSVYGRAAEVRPKSSYYLMCVFLGNEIPQSSSVNALYKIKANTERIESLEENANSSIENLQSQIDVLDEVSSSHASKLTEIEESLTSFTNDLNVHSDQINSLELDISSLQDADTLINTNVSNLQTQLAEIYASVINTINPAIEALEEDNEINKQNIELKADKTYIDTELNKKQIKLIPGSGISLDDSGNIAIDLSALTLVIDGGNANGN